MGAVIMKMMSSTSMTSTSGTTLISASVLATRRPRPSRPRAPFAAGSTFGMGLGGIALGDVEEFHREIVHFRREYLYPLGQKIVEIHGWDRGEEASGRRHERFGDAGRHDTQVGRAGLSDVLERAHNAPHSPEQPDKGRNARRRREKRNPAFELVHLDCRRAQQRAIDRRQALESWTIGGQSWIGSSRSAVRRVLTQLCRKLRVARLKQTHQRTLAKRRADRLAVRKFLAAPEDLGKTGALAVRAAECP